MTPCTRVIVMDKWVKDYIRNWDNTKIDKFESLILNSITEQGNNLQGESLNVKSTLSRVQENLDIIKNLFQKYHVNNVTPFEDIEKMIMKIIFSLLSRDEKVFSQKLTASLLKNENFIKSVVVLGVEITLFIENVELICFYKLANVLSLDLYEFWKVLNPFIRVDLTIPSDIRLHFEEIEIGLWSFMIFKTASSSFKLSVDAYLKSLKKSILFKELRDIQNLEFNNQSLFVYHDRLAFNDQSNCIVPTQSLAYSQLSPIYILLRRILNYSIFLNKKVAENLNLSTESAKESEQLLKRLITFSEYFDVMYDKHIDQVVVCCLIAILKKRDLFKQKNLQEIVKAYKAAKPDMSENHPLSRIDRAGTTLLDLYSNFIKKVDKLVDEICLAE